MRSALQIIHANGHHNFEYVALVNQVLNGGPYIYPARTRLINDYNFAGNPTSFFDGGDDVFVGAYSGNIPAQIAAYEGILDIVGTRVVPELEIITAIEWLGNSIVKNHVRIANGTSVNTAPATPANLTGPDDALLGVIQFETAGSTDADGDSLYYQFDVAGTRDGLSGWLGPYAAGDAVTYDYDFTTIGDYTVSVRSKEVWGNVTDFTPLHSISIRCCDVRADINDSGVGPDISDLVYLVTYMFSSGPPPPCLEAADINGSGSGPDISDLVYLVTYMFSGGPAPAPCGP